MRNVHTFVYSVALCGNEYLFSAWWKRWMSTVQYRSQGYWKHQIIQRPVYRCVHKSSFSFLIHWVKHNGFQNGIIVHCLFFVFVKILTAFNKKQSEMELLKSLKEMHYFFFLSGIAKSILPLHFLGIFKNSFRILS